MVNYTCNNCNKTFTRKSDFIYHTEKKKKPCRPNTDLDPHKPAQVPHKTAQIAEKNDKLKNTSDSDSNNHSDTEIKHICTFCKDQFTRQDSLKRHTDKYCKVKKKEDKLKIIDEIEQLKKKFEEKILEIEKQSKELCELKKEIDTTTKSKLKTINNTTNTNNIVVNNNINILPHGSETKVNLLTILEQLANHKDMLMLIPNMAKHIYIDTPENKNFRIVDLSRNKCEYYDGKKWVAGKTDDKIIKVFENVNNVLTGPFDKENLIKTLKFIESNKELKEKTKWINFSKGYCLSLWDETDPENIENKKKIINELKYIFFNYRDEILKINL